MYTNLLKHSIMMNNILKSGGYDVLKSDIKLFPKAELHCHLDGSIRPKTLQKIAKEQNLPISDNLDDISAQMKAPTTCQNLVDYLTCFDYVLPFLQTEKALEIASFDVMEQAAEDGIRYIEIRFAPSLSMKKGLSVEETIKAVARGIAQAEKKYEVIGNILVIGMKNDELSGIQTVFSKTHLLDHEKVVGFDLAGAERDYFVAEYEGLLEVATNQGSVLLTLHAGECGCIHNVFDAIDAGAKRIGHGIALKGNDEAQKRIATRDVCIEGCPTSNVQTRAIDSFVDYPISEWLDNQVTFCINTDNKTVSDTTLTKEYEILYDYHELTSDTLRLLNQNAAKYSFASEKMKDQLIKEMSEFIFSKENKS